MPKKSTAASGYGADYDEAVGAAIVANLAEGRCLEVAAGLLGVSMKTLRVWRIAHPSLEQAIQQGRARGIALLEDLLRDAANGGPGNASVLFKMLINRTKSEMGWHEDAIAAQRAAAREKGRLDKERKRQKRSPEEHEKKRAEKKRLQAQCRVIDERTRQNSARLSREEAARWRREASPPSKPQALSEALRNLSPDLPRQRAKTPA